MAPWILSRSGRCRHATRAVGTVTLMIGSLFLLAGRDVERPVSQAATARSALERTDAEVLASLHSCTACHRAGEEVARRIPSRPGPDLRRAGHRLSPDYLRAYLTAPQRVKSHTTMPDLLHGLSPTEKTETVEDLVHYLQSRHGPFEVTPTQTSHAVIETGRKLYETLGCQTCHPRENPARLASMTSVTALTEFLRDPVKTRPSGRMPGMKLTQSEAGAIAQYLLREQIQEPVDPESERRPGLQYEYFEGRFDPGDNNFEGRDPVTVGTSERISIEPRKRNDRFGFRFTGQITIEEPGRYTFHTRVDDHSWLWIDGQLVVNNLGRGNRWSSGEIELSSGRHAIVVTMHEHGGGEFLKVEWEGPGIRRAEIPGSLLSHRPLFMTPPGTTFIIDDARVRAGANHFESLGCANCHETERAPLAATEFDQLSANSTTGCLSQSPADDTPKLTLTANERDRLETLLGERKALTAAHTPAERLDYWLAYLQCTACHTRGERGPTEEALLGFVSTAELGDEGRVPPTLTGAGHRLKPGWTHDVLLEGEIARPYMVTRMPQYGAAAEPLPALFEQVDAIPGDDVEPSFSPTLAETGRLLIGEDGFSCLICHRYASYGDPKTFATDLAKVYQRIKPAWQNELLRDPMAVNPGTRMLAYFSDDENMFPEILDGDPERQMTALRIYMSLGPTKPLPRGAAPDRSGWDLNPEEEVIVFGTFMEGLSARVMAVGHPEGIHYAFDAENVRLAKAWRGGFINAQGTWRGRAGQLEAPDSTDVIDLPRGQLFAFLDSDAAIWPRAGAREAEWTMSGTRRDAERRPSFLYEGPGLTVHETLLPKEFDDKLGLSRRFTISTTTPDRALSMRPLSATEIELRDGWYVSDRGLRMRVLGAAATVRSSADRAELIVAVPSAPDSSIVQLEIEMTW